jgi:hypothetical protein
MHIKYSLQKKRHDWLLFCRRMAIIHRLSSALTLASDPPYLSRDAAGRPQLSFTPGTVPLLGTVLHTGIFISDLNTQGGALVLLPSLGHSHILYSEEEAGQGRAGPGSQDYVGPGHVWGRDRLCMTFMMAACMRLRFAS